MSSDAAHTDRGASHARRAALLDDWARLERELAVIHARQAELLAERLDLLVAEPEGVPDGGDLSLRSLAAEYGAAAHIPPSTAAIRLTDAWMLVRRFPAAHASLAAGRISCRHADVIISESPEVGSRADAAEVRAAYEEQVIPFAEAETAARTRVHARQVATRLLPQETLDAHARGRARRSVTVRPDGEGMAVLTAILPEILAYAIRDRLTAQARQQRHASAAAASAARASASPASVAPASADPALADPASASPALADPVSVDPAFADPFPDAAPPPPLPEDPADIGITDLTFRSRAHASHEETAPIDRLGPVPGAPAPEESFFDAAFDAVIAGFFDAPLPEDPASSGPHGPEAPLDHDPAPPEQPIGVHKVDTRTLDQLRADILSDLLLTADPATVTQTGLESLRATVHVTVSARTLTGEEHRPAELEGVGPLDPDVARILAGRSASWDRLFLDPGGMVTRTDGYTPTAAMKRFLRARDQHCRFPGCRAPAHRCQIDHNHDHAKGGPTALCNLALFCTGHHPIKHPDVPAPSRWSARQLADGTIEWISPLGRVYPDRAPRRVLFV